jgi:CubicO group peptidase (beta-lactamase class C family)
MMTNSRTRIGARWVVAVVLLACGSDTVDPTGPSNDKPITVTREEGLVGFPAALDSIRVVLRIPGMAAAMAQDGHIVWARGFGYANAESERRALSTTPFHLASLTKPFASVILMQLVEQGLVDLDDPASDYGVDLTSTGTITVRHLLTHTSEGTPGSTYRYNGNRYGHLDRVILSASGRSFGSLLVEKILQPLGLADTAPNPLQRSAFDLTGLDWDAFSGRMASGYELRGIGIVRRSHPDYFGVSAGLVASAEDVATFSLAIDEGRFLAPPTWQEVFTPAASNAGAPLPYGLGWFIHQHEGVLLQWHYGHWTTNSSLIVRVPEEGLTFVVVANTAQLSAAYGLGGDSDVLRSDVARLFIEHFVLGDEPLPTGRLP